MLVAALSDKYDASGTRWHVPRFSPDRTVRKNNG